MNDPKEQFYAELDKLHADSDGEDVDVGRKASENKLSTAKSKRHTRNDISAIKNLPRSLSDSHSITERVDHDVPASAGPRASNITSPARLLSRHTIAGESMLPEHGVIQIPRHLSTGNDQMNARVSGGKRKRGHGLPAPSNNHLVFRDLRFFFFPNNNVHPGRRMRIGKAIQFGASWQKDWSDTVTHVVVDKNIDYGLLLKYLKLDALPPGVVLVNEDYPADCISYRCILDSNHRQYKVKSAPVIGCAESNVARETPFISSDRSLPLKEKGKPTQRRGDSTSQSSGITTSPIDLMKSPQAGAFVAETVLQTDTPAEPTNESINFERIIEQARGLQQLPLDENGESSDEGNKNVSNSSILSKKQSAQNTFQCMHKHTAGRDADSPNHTTIDILQQMADYYNMMGDEWRTRAYRKAISALRKYPEKIHTREQALRIPQIGDRIATKIEEIAFTNRLRRLDAALAEPEDKVLQTFMGIYGVGFNQASKWVAHGYRSLDDLLQKAEITTNQRIGIEHYNDFNTRVPRTEVEKIGSIVRKSLEKLDPQAELIVGGSYRRGAESSGDVDCIITHPELNAMELRKLVFDRLVPKLTSAQFFVAQLSTSSRSDGSKWLGACQLPTSSTDEGNTNPWRRIDLLVVPPSERGAALIYFTGNDLFNRSMRLLASTKGMRLNQRGLYKDVLRGAARVKITEGTLIEGRDEKKIFAALGVPWRPPTERVC